MKVVLESMRDVEMINWPNVTDECIQQFKRALCAALERAANEIKELTPGETRKIPVEFADIEISRAL